MRKLLTLLDEWAAKAIRLIRPGQKNKSNVLTDNIHLKNKRTAEEVAYEQERVVLPDQYYVTRTGQTMRKPVKVKKYYKRFHIGEKNK